MDTLSHYLWTVPLYWQHPKRWYIGIIGAMPDILSFGAYLVMGTLAGTIVHGPQHSPIPSWVYMSYNVTHSLVIFALTFTLLWLWKKEWALLTFGWPLHILIDLPTHTTQFFPTPLLWPLFDVQYNGLSWATGWYFATNAACLLAVYGYLFWRIPSAKHFKEHS